MNSEKAPYNPLTEDDVKRIYSTALDVLENIGMGHVPDFFRDTAISAGCTLSDGRLRFPRALVDDVVARAGRLKERPARNNAHRVKCHNGTAIYGHGGIAPMVFDFNSGEYRDSTLLDIYDITRLSDKLDNVDVVSESVVPNDIANPFEQDINKAYINLVATQKSFTMSLLSASHVAPIVEMYDLALGAEGAFRKNPFCTISGCPTVSPLRYDDVQTELLTEAARQGFPVQVVIAPMAGATAPTAMAGTLVQVLAEGLASLIMIDLMIPGAPVVVGLWPFISDLRTGSFVGGGGEAALISAAAGQILNYCGLSGSVSGGITDAKALDSQSGFEKGISAALSSLSGSGLVGESVGMMASLMACSLEAMVIDDEMLGCIKRAKKGIHVNENTLSLNVIADIVEGGAGNYLAHPQTLSMMKSEYYYPKLMDRGSIEEWEKNGRLDMQERSRATVRKVLSSHYPEYITPEVDSKIRDRFPIHLPQSEMLSTSSRW